MIKFDVLNRWTGKVQFTADIDCNVDAANGVKVGLSVQWARKRDAVLSGAVLRGAVLSGAVLSDAVLRDAVLRGAVLSDAVLSGADLSGAVLSGADLSGAVLSGAVLSGAVLSDGLNGVPVIPNIHAAVYAAASQPGALDMTKWHCGTTHCRAGWVVTLAGDAGRALEWAMGTPAAAAMIYLASDPTLDRVPDFYCDNNSALADMRRRAEPAVADATPSS
jgi:uncharacterized protein YjbI with pentapeptide repeats